MSDRFFAKISRYRENAYAYRDEDGMYKSGVAESVPVAYKSGGNYCIRNDFEFAL